MSVPSFLAGAVLRYPLDVHNVHCKLAFDPLPARKWLLPSKLMEARAKIPIYQLSPPASFSLLQKPRKFFKSDDKEMKIVEEFLSTEVHRESPFEDEFKASILAESLLSHTCGF